MNRFDEIMATALDAAQHVTDDPARREELACDLIKLIGLMTAAVGKRVAVDGEGDMNTPGPDADRMDVDQYLEAFGRYRVGEALRGAADNVVECSVGADLDRYIRSGLDPVWAPRCRECGERDGHLEHCNGCNRLRPGGCAILPNGQGPACDWDPDCPDHGSSCFDLPTALVEHTDPCLAAADGAGYRDDCCDRGHGES